MAFTINISNKLVEIKFNYRLMFAVQNKLGTMNKETKERNSDGVGTLLLKFINQEDEGIIDLIKLTETKNRKYTEVEILDGIEEYINEYDDVEEGYDAIFNELKGELVESGFFRKKISAYIDTMNRYVKIMESQDNVEQAQIDMVLEEISKLQEAIS